MNRIVTGCVLLLCLTVLSGCPFSKLFGKKDDSGSNTSGKSSGLGANNATENAGSITLPDGQQDVSYDFTPPSEGGDVTWSATGLPSWAQLDPATGHVTGYPDDMGSYDITFLIKTGGKTLNKTSTLKVTGDPLVKYAWHLYNDGNVATAFAKNPGVEGQDMKVRDVIRSGITGKGIHVAVSDTGIAIAHEDLKNNILANASRDYNTAPTNNKYSGDPTPRNGDENDDGNAHGTAVAGLIGAEKWNGVGSAGIAPNVKLMGFNYLLGQSSAGVDIDQITSYEGNMAVDIFNQSWGYSDFAYVSLDQTYIDALKNGTTTYRNGNGALYVRAAGNGYVACNQNGCLRSSSDSTKFLTQSANSQGVNTVPYVTVVGALNAKGVRTSYTSPGSAVWISATGGEFGTTDPAMITTDMPGNVGFSHDDTKTFEGRVSPNNAFEFGSIQKMLNPNFDYTSIMNGTSSASPSAAAVIALILEANPALKWKDVNYILAKTATQVDANFQPLHCGFDITGAINEPGWTTNAAGFKFHNSYGFGRVNAKAAVDLAKTTTPSASPALQTPSTPYTKSLNLAIPNKSLTGASDKVTVQIPGNPKLYTVLLHVSSTHTRPAELQIELTSPSGTTSVVLGSCNSFVGNDLTSTTLNDAVFRTNTFLDETPNGDWTITVKDLSDLVFGNETATAHTGSLTSYTLEFYY